MSLRILPLLGALAFLPAKATEFDRPAPPGGGPTIVSCAFSVADLDAVSDADQNFTVKLYSEFSWLDPSLAHDDDKLVTKPLSEIWHPDISFINIQRSWGENSRPEVEVDSDGRVRLEQSRWGHFSQPLELQRFPFDTQYFEIRAVSSETTSDVRFVPSSVFDSFISEDYSVADWDVIGSEVDTIHYKVPDGELYPSFAFTVQARRLATHYVVKIIAPLVLIIAVSWIVFWLDPKEGGSQLGVAVTSFLTVIAYHISLGSSLPRIHYLTRLDVFVFGGTLLVFLAVIEVVITTNCARRKQLAKARKIDQACRYIFPSVMLAISIYAFGIH